MAKSITNDSKNEQKRYDHEFEKPNSRNEKRSIDLLVNAFIMIFNHQSGIITSNPYIETISENIYDALDFI